MSSVKTQTPASLKPFIGHGLELKSTTGDQYEGECPNPQCGKLFRVNAITGQWDCKGCRAKGNSYTFLRWMWEMGRERVSDSGENTRLRRETLAAFTKSRSLRNPKTLQEWGLSISVVTGDWILPGYDVRGEVMNLYVYKKILGEKKRKLLSTAGCEHQLFGMNLFDRRKGRIYLCESVWDAMTLYEFLPRIKETDSGIAWTMNRNLSIANSVNVLAVPGANVFREQWCELFAGKQVCLLYHSDHPKILPDGTTQPPGGYLGMRRAVKLLTGATEPPANMYYLYWGDEGYDKGLKSGYDVRDWVMEGYEA